MKPAFRRRWQEPSLPKRPSANPFPSVPATSPQTAHTCHGKLQRAGRCAKIARALVNFNRCAAPENGHRRATSAASLLLAFGGNDGMVRLFLRRCCNRVRTFFRPRFVVQRARQGIFEDRAEGSFGYQSSEVPGVRMLLFCCATFGVQLKGGSALVVL